MQVTVARDLGLAVRGRRQELGLSQTTLSEQAAVSRKWLSEFEQGKPSAEIGLMLRVLDAVGLRLIIETNSGVQSAAAPTAHTVDLDGLLNDLGGTS